MIALSAFLYVRRPPPQALRPDRDLYSRIASSVMGAAAAAAAATAADAVQHRTPWPEPQGVACI